MIDYDDDQPKGQKLYEFWKTEIDETFTFIKDRYWPKWEKWLRLDRGEHWQDYEAEDRDNFSSDNPPTKITCNLLGPWARQLTAYVVNRDGYLGLEPLNTESIYNGIALEAAANQEWRQCHMRTTLKDSFLQGAVIGWTAAETGYTIEVDEAVNPLEDGYLEYRDYVKIDQPYARKINTFSFAYDLAAPEKNLETARWVCEEFFQEPSYVLNNSKYNPATIRAIRTGDEHPEAVLENDLHVKDMPEAMKKLWCLRKVWDRRFRKFYIFLKGCTRPLVERDWPYPYISEFPIKMFNYIKLPNEWFGISMFEWLEDGQYELNRTLTSMFDYRRRNQGGQSQIAEIDPKAKAEYLRGEKLIATGDSKIEPIALPPFSPDQYAILSNIINMMERISGLSEITQGATTSGRRSATSDRIRGQFTMMRLDDLVESWNIFTEQIGYDWIKHIQNNRVTERMQALNGALGSYWTQLTGQQPGIDGNHWVRADSTYLRGDFQLRLESTVRPKQDTQMELQQRMAYLGKVEQSVQLAAMLQKPFDYNPVEAVKWAGEANGYDRSLPRFVTNAATVPPPIQTQAGQQPQAALQSPQQQVFAEAATPESAIAGALQGGTGSA